MLEKYCIVLIDVNGFINDITISIFEKQNGCKLTFLRQFQNKFYTRQNIDLPAKTIEFIGQVALTNEAIGISEWKICARNINKLLLKEISKATNINSELLIRQREKELLCKGIILEMIQSM